LPTLPKAFSEKNDTRLNEVEQVISKSDEYCASGHMSGKILNLFILLQKDIFEM
jgi:hypothetical protein